MNHSATTQKTNAKSALEGPIRRTNVILVVGQTPPPLGGQTIMIQRLLEGTYQNVKFVHVRMGFSDGLDKVGKFHLSKLLELVNVMIRIVVARMRCGADILYYPPAGPNFVPIMRDLAILCGTRWLFRKTIFHFHSGGLCQYYSRLRWPLRKLFDLAYRRPDVAIRVAASTPPDAMFLRAEREFIVHNGVPDEASAYQKKHPRAGVNSDPKALSILFVAVLREDKGVMVLLRACHILKEKSVDFVASFVGKFVSEAFRESVMDYVVEAGLKNHVCFPGVLDGDAKLAAYHEADVFCFPTFFDSETFSLVIIEALSFGIPVVTTRWSGIPDMLEGSGAAFLVPPQDDASVAEALVSLAGDKDLRRQMGGNARRRYAEHYTLDHHRAALQKAFDSLQNSD
jgi:glycosyltransferase involved in cell wall biosynthesis